MASSSYADYLRPPALPVDMRSHKSFEDEDSTILDDAILDGSLESADIFHEFADQESVSTTSSNAFYKTNAFYSHPVSSWASGSCTPTTVYEGLATDHYEAEHSASYLSGTPTTASSAGFDAPLGNASLSLFSTPSTANFAAPSVCSDQSDGRSMSKRMQPGSPLHPHSPLLRRADAAVRKKNARFEIPAERNLHNIDHFIAHSSDDQEIKELKQQKRLLRNRQAA